MADAEQEKVPRVTSFKGILSKRKSYFERDSLTCNIIHFLLNLNYHGLCLGIWTLKVWSHQVMESQICPPTKNSHPRSLELEGRTYMLLFLRSWCLSGMSFFCLYLLQISLLPTTVRHHVTSWSRMDHIYNSGPKRLWWTGFSVKKGRICGSEECFFLWREQYLWALAIDFISSTSMLSAQIKSQSVSQPPTRLSTEELSPLRMLQRSRV